jgi:uncharacterized membrane protein YgcG
MKRLFVFIFLIATLQAVAQQNADCEKLTQYGLGNPQKTLLTTVFDQANVLSPETEIIINRLLLPFNRDSSGQIMVITTPDANASAIDIAVDFINCWGVGHKGANNGVVIALATDGTTGDVAIAIGSGLEGYYLDSETASFINEAKPDLKGGKDFNSAVIHLVNRSIQTFGRIKLGERKHLLQKIQEENEQRQRERLSSFGDIMFVLLFVFLFWWYTELQIRKKNNQTRIKAMCDILKDMDAGVTELSINKVPNYPKWAQYKFNELANGFEGKVSDALQMFHNCDLESNKKVAYIEKTFFDTTVQIYDRVARLPTEIEAMKSGAEKLQSEMFFLVEAVMRLRKSLAEGEFKLISLDGSAIKQMSIFLRGLPSDFAKFTGNQHKEVCDYHAEHYNTVLEERVRLENITKRTEIIKNWLKSINSRITQLESRYTVAIGCFDELMEICPETVWSDKFTHDPADWSAQHTTLLEILSEISENYEIKDMLTRERYWTLYLHCEEIVVEYETLFGKETGVAGWICNENNRQQAAKDSITSLLALAEREKSETSSVVGKKSFDTSENESLFNKLIASLQSFASQSQLERTDWCLLAENIKNLAKDFDTLEAEAISDARKYIEYLENEERKRLQRIAEEKRRTSKGSDSSGSFTLGGGRSSGGGSSSRF